MSGIGVLNEKPLHASLKEWYMQPEDKLEVSVNGYVIDIVRGDRLLEIQTANFASMKTKLSKLLCNFEVQLIYPIPLEKWIVKPSHNDPLKFTRRKSPKIGRIEELFAEMLRFPGFALNTNFGLEVLLIKEEEVRRFDGKFGWRRNGWVIEERRLVEVTDRKLFKQPADYLALLPENLEEPFTARDLAGVASIGRPLAQKMIYCLKHMRVLEAVGKRKQAPLYVACL